MVDLRAAGQLLTAIGDLLGKGLRAGEQVAFRLVPVRRAGVLELVPVGWMHGRGPKGFGDFAAASGAPSSVTSPVTLHAPCRRAETPPARPHHLRRTDRLPRKRAAGRGQLRNNAATCLKMSHFTRRRVLITHTFSSEPFLNPSWGGENLKNRHVRC